ncbi:MAG: histidine phosphatase family protein [Bacteroidetes bacterium]|nr:MAG: histidine phosphatase family protein [Bacteroidota bacterium]
MCQQVFFLRHAEVDQPILLGQRYDAPLSAEGRKQAQAWAERLRDIPFQAIFTSPAQRARETAALLAGEKISLLAFPHFLEVSWGQWEGMPRETAEPLLQLQAQKWAEGAWDWSPPGGEALSSALKRALEGLQLAYSLYPTGNLLIVTHGRLLQALLCHLLGYPPAEQRRFYHRRGQLTWAVRLPQGLYYLRALAVNADTPL